jgi:hypothetical protein
MVKKVVLIISLVIFIAIVSYLIMPKWHFIVADKSTLIRYNRVTGEVQIFNTKEGWYVLR